jgi:hypothetical protein
LYADDAAILARTWEELQEMINILDEELRKSGMYISINKTKILCVNKNLVLREGGVGRGEEGKVFKIRGQDVEIVNEFKYLGSTITNTNNVVPNNNINTTTTPTTTSTITTHDIPKNKRGGGGGKGGGGGGGLWIELNKRKFAASRVWGKLYRLIFTRKDLTITTKANIYKLSVLPVLLYTCETWSISKSQLEYLEVYHRRCLRKIAKKSLRDHFSNEKLLTLTKTPSISTFISKSRWHWFGKIMDNDLVSSWTKQATCGRIREGSRGKGRASLRWSDLVLGDGRERLQEIVQQDEEGDWKCFPKLAKDSYHKNRKKK